MRKSLIDNLENQKKSKGKCKGNNSRFEKRNGGNEENTNRGKTG